MTDSDTRRHLPAIVDATPPATRSENLAPLDYLILLWLHEQASPRTRVEYAATMADFRAYLAGVGLDLDVGDHTLLAQMAQMWSKRPTRQRGREGNEPSPAITARRLAILSSFFLYAIRNDMQEWKRDRKTGEMYRDTLDANPLRKLKRPKVQRYAEAQPMELRELMARLRHIDRATPEGMRDYALISVALMTGRRIAELQGMTRAALTFGRDGRVTARWATKGGKVMRDHLDAKTSAALIAYLRAVYAVETTAQVAALPPKSPVWVSFSHATPTLEQKHHQGERQPLSTSGIRRVFLRRLGTSKAHVTRHSFAMLMEQAGASLTDIQARLGHASAKTTADYMNALKSADNPYSDRLAALLGLE